MLRLYTIYILPILIVLAILAAGAPPWLLAWRALNHVFGMVLGA